MTFGRGRLSTWTFRCVRFKIFFKFFFQKKNSTVLVFFFHFQKKKIFHVTVFFQKPNQGVRVGYLGLGLGLRLGVG